MTTDIESFKNLIRQRSGLLVSGLAEDILTTAIKTRMRVCKLADTSAYYATILADEAEFLELLSRITVNETYFFREPEHLSFLTSKVVPRLLAERDNRLPLRILSAGCSTGEEPYSIAIALAEKFGSGVSGLVSILAGDIDSHALARARQATYGEFSFRAMPPDLKARYFTRASPRAHVLNEEIRVLVDFRHMNLMSDALAPEIADFDVVFFRNVSIYFDPQTRMTIQTTLHSRMKVGASLFLGVSETLANDLGVFRLIEEDGLFHFVKRPLIAARSVPIALRPALPLAIRPERKSPPRAPAPAVVTLDTVRTLIRDENYGEAVTAVATLRAQSPTDIGPLLLDGYIHLLMRDFTGAAALARKAQELDNWSADAGVLLGLSAKWGDDTEQAIQSFKQVIYAKPDCWPARFHLADILRTVDLVKARREYGIVLRQVQAVSDPDGGLLLPLNLPLADVRFLCERHGQPFIQAKPGVKIRGA
ncbi:MAG: protein-glutamate O-methyltransferase CheR [Alphaproteobacteria bacterium]|nr:protein-glutamate O-methyltransferase CheR [Alphaproteobacteria bacterium]